MTMGGNYHYTMCGQSLSSEIPLPELHPSHSEGDISIRIGTVPENLSKAGERGVCWQAETRRLLLYLPKIGRFLVENGSSITMEPVEGASEQDLRVFLLGSAMGALFHQRHLFPLHGSAILTREGAMAIIGASGTGKSTLAAALAQRGHRVLCDELCVCTRSENGFQLWPETSHLRLWHDTLKHLKLSDRTLTRLRARMEKFLYSPKLLSSSEPHPLSRIVVLSTDNRTGVRREPLRGMQKFNALKQNCFRFEYLASLDLSVPLFRLYSQLATSAPMTRVVRSRGTRDIPLLADFVERELTS